MFFTKEDILKIQEGLIKTGARDSEFENAKLPLNNNDILVLSQGNKNVKIRVQDFLQQLHLLSSGDFINVTGKFDAHYLTLAEAIRKIPSRTRKVGLIITFQNIESDWETWQYNSSNLNQWNEITAWERYKIPTNSVGYCTFNEKVGKPIWWNGSNWVDATGSIVQI